MMRYFLWALVQISFLSTLIACSESSPWGNGGGGDGDRLVWPGDPVASVLGGSSPDVVVTAEGVILLSLGREGRSEVIVDPGGEERVVDLGPGAGGRIACSPDEEEAVVLFHQSGERLLAAWLADGELVAPAFELVDDREDWGLSRNVRGLSLYWTGAGPAAFMHSHLNQVTQHAPDGSVAFRQDPRSDFILLGVPRPDKGSVRLPPLSMRLGTANYHMISHGESPTLFDLSDHPVSTEDEPKVLGALSRVTRSPNDDQALLQWVLAKTYPGADGAWGSWYGPVSDGTSEMPEQGYPAWVEIHRLGPRDGVVTWHAPSGGMVFDVFMAKLTIDDEGKPIVGSSFVNVSQTYGNTDHSEHPIVRATGDGRIWVTWRETTFGPRVALYDSDLSRLGVVAPAREFHQSQSAPLGAAVLPGGDLLIAAELWPRGEASEVRLWRVELP